MMNKAQKKIPEVIVIAAVAENGVIGKQGGLPWHLPEELKRFKRLTMGNPIIMGRKTHESIGRVLPGRRNIVLSSSDLKAPGIDVFSSLEAALAACQNVQKVFIIGGGQIFKQALPLAQKIELTRVHQHIAGDVYFPEIKLKEWQVVATEPHDGYTFITFQRLTPNA